MKRLAFTLAAAAAVAACDEGGTSTAEAEAAAEREVRQRFGLAQDAELETQVFVGRPRDGETTLCGTVTGASIPPQRFIAATDPTRWLLFEERDPGTLVTQTDRFVEWETHCRGAEGDEGEEPLAPTERGEG